MNRKPYCYKCKTEEDLFKANQFNSHICRKCRNEKYRIYAKSEKGKANIKKYINNFREKYPDKYLAKIRDKQRRKRKKDGWLVSNRKSKKKYNEANVEKVRAHRSLQKAVKTGKIIKPNTCQKCLKEVPKNLLHGHHEDYSKRLEVIWLCIVCHKKQHEINTKVI